MLGGDRIPLLLAEADEYIAWIFGILIFIISEVIVPYMKRKRRASGAQPEPEPAEEVRQIREAVESADVPDEVKQMLLRVATRKMRRLAADFADSAEAAPEKAAPERLRPAEAVVERTHGSESALEPLRPRKIVAEYASGRESVPESRPSVLRFQRGAIAEGVILREILRRPGAGGMRWSSRGSRYREAR